jgi:S-adenosylmethionine decarboxylase proenzyme
MSDDTPMRSARLGIHLILDVAGAPFATLDDPQVVEAALIATVDEMGAHVLGSHVHRLSPQGISGVVVITESHVTIHTWPERGEAAVDLFTCGDPVRARRAVAGLAGRLGATRSNLRELHRGFLEEAGQIVPRPDSGRIASLQVSRGGVPKRSIAQVTVGTSGILEDAQAHRQIHGGVDRAVSLFSGEVIERLRAEGHPIAPGTAGENVTLEGLDWAALKPGRRLQFDGGVLLEIASFCNPCKVIGGSFRDAEFARIDAKKNPDESRLSCRVIVEGILRQGEGVRLV